MTLPFSGTIYDNDQPIGVLTAFMHWAEQSHRIVHEEPSFTPEEWQHTRVMILDANRYVIAASDNEGLLSSFPLEASKNTGHTMDTHGRTIIYSFVPEGSRLTNLGWSCVMVQEPELAAR